MKKSLLIIALAVSIISCNKEQQTTASAEMKTAYVDTAKLMEEYTEAKDLDAKFKSKSEAEAKKFEVEDLQKLIKRYSKKTRDIYVIPYMYHLDFSHTNVVDYFNVR